MGNNPMIIKEFTDYSKTIFALEGGEMLLKQVTKY